MRTTPEENAAAGRFIAERLNTFTGPVAFLIPEGGVSALDAPGQPFHDPEADAALFDALRDTLDDTIELTEIETVINDEEFALTLARHLDERLRDAGHGP